jgi:hypothetical protein
MRPSLQALGGASASGDLLYSKTWRGTQAAQGRGLQNLHSWVRIPPAPPNPLFMRLSVNLSFCFYAEGRGLGALPPSADLSFWLNFRVGNCANDLLTKCRTNSDWRSCRSAIFLPSLFSAYDWHVSLLRPNGPTAIKMSHCRVCSRTCESSWWYFGGLCLDPGVLGKLFRFRSPGGKDTPPRSVDRASISSNPV